MAAALCLAGMRLTALPSKPGPHAPKIEALGDNEWLGPGAPKPDLEFGHTPDRARYLRRR